MSVVDFLYKTKRLGFQGVQLCENLALSELDKKELLAIKEKAKDLDLFIEVGMNELSERSLLKYMDMAKMLSSNLLRVVLSRKTYNDLGNDIQHLYEKSLYLLKNVVIECKRNNIYIGIENHFDLPTKMLVDLVKKIDDEHVGLIFDTTNHLAFIEKPQDTLHFLMPHLISVHLKDYFVQKVEAGYLISGTVLGEGRLETRKILHEIFSGKNNILSIILEMTIKRKTGQGISEIVNWERKAVKKSTYYLNNIIDEFKNTVRKGE